MFAEKTKTKIGLDIGSHSIKMVKLSIDKNIYRLAGIGSIKPQSSSEQGIVDSIRELTKQLKVTTKDVTISVSGAQVIVRFITIPKMKEADIRGALHFEAEKYIPFNINDVIIEYQVLKTSEQGRKLDLVLACAKKDYIMKHIAFAEKADLSVEAVDVDGFALSNAFFKNSKEQNRAGAVALVNIGATTTNIVIMDGEILSFARDIQFGGRALDDEIAKNLGVDHAHAEALKLDPKERKEEVGECTKNAFLTLFSELRLSIGYFDNQFGKPVSDIYLSGGVSGVEGIEQIFEENLGIKAATWDPVSFLEIDEKSIDRNALRGIKRSLAVCVGLTVR